MKQIVFIFGCIFFSTLVTATIETSKLPASYDPLLVVVLMVKDEALVMRATLESFVKGGISHFFIFDTGSTDDTVAVTKAYFKEQGITTYYIEQEAFVDFATSRNRALVLAEEKFSTACFMLMPDAEWYLVNGHKLVEFCEQHKHESHASYMVRILHPTMDFYTQRLMRVRERCRFAGVVHESVTKVTFEKLPPDIFFDLRVSTKGAQKTAARWHRDKELLLKEFKEQPESARTCFYLAQTYDCLDDMETAAQYYRMRTQLAGWDEENFMGWYRLGAVLEKLPVEKGGGWLAALECYLRAYNMRPTRIEPLMKIAFHYLRENNHPLAFLFAQRACQIPYPAQDVLFVEKEVYEFTRYDVLGQCAWYAGEYEAGEKAVREAMKARPDVPHILRNLAHYLDKKLQRQRAAAAA